MKSNNRIAFSNAWSSWDSWHRPSLSKHHETAPDYDYQAIWGVMKHRFKMNDIPKDGKLVIDFKDNQIIAAELLKEEVTKAKGKKK